jgi:chorismate mutase
MTVRGIRGAIDVASDDPQVIAAATRRLLEEIITRNGLTIDDVACALFSMTPDLRAAFPARAARELGWHDVPMLSFTEIDVPGALTRVLRVLVLINTTGTTKVRHVYLGRAATLRPDLAAPSA